MEKKLKALKDTLDSKKKSKQKATAAAKKVLAKQKAMKKRDPLAKSFSQEFVARRAALSAKEKATGKGTKKTKPTVPAPRRLTLRTLSSVEHAEI